MKQCPGTLKDKWEAGKTVFLWGKKLQLSFNLVGMGSFNLCYLLLLC